MKKRFSLIAGVMALSTLVYFTAFAQEANQQKSINDLLSLIREEQNATAIEQINPDKASDALLEQLGDAVLSEYIPDQRQHEWMDNMMGGEGSQTLASMHRLMGYRYLQGYRFDRYTGGGMMGPGWEYMGMMGPNGLRNPVWFGWGFPVGWIWIPVLGGLLIAGTVFLLLRKSRKNRDDNPLEILKIRLAKGEITKEEFDKLKTDIQ